MKYPYRVVVEFKPGRSKLPLIQYINRFLNNDAIGEWDKYTLYHTKDFERRMHAIEIAFTDSTDAVHFKLGFDYGHEEIN